jgi:monoamine oxidase
LDRDGNHQIIEKLAAKLSDRIETNTRLESIRSTPNNRYRVSLQQGERSKEYTFDRVILAVPFSILRKLDLGVRLPPLKRAAIKELGYGSNTKLITSYSDRLWRDKYYSIGQSFSDLDTSEIVIEAISSRESTPKFLINHCLPNSTHTQYKTWHDFTTVDLRWRF